MNGIIQTALTGLPLELEYRPLSAHNQRTDPETFTDTYRPHQQAERTPSDEFACLLSAMQEGEVFMTQEEIRRARTEFLSGELQ